jgi:quinol-cytochrome oxidoreductase complex cytochrome b subunit
MTTDLNLMFFWLFVAMFMALGIASFVESKNSQATKSESYFALLYLVFAVGLVIYKMMGH